MAAIETLPIDQLPDLEVTRAAAEWEQKFKRPKMTNLAERHWENQATLAHAANETARADVAFKQRLMRDQTAQNYFFKSQELPMELEKHNADMEFRREKFEHDKTMFPITIAARKAATIAAMSRTEAMSKGNLWKEELHAQEAKDTVGFTDYVRGLGHKRGTPEFANALADARLKFPAMDHVLFQDVWKTHSGQELDPDEALKRFQETVKALPGDTVAAKLPGGISVTSRPEKPAPDTIAKDQARLSTRLSRLESLRSKDETKLSKNQLDYYDGQIKAVSAQLDALSKGAAITLDDESSDAGSQTGAAPSVTATTPAAPAVSERAVVNPKTGERLVLRNGAWVKP